MKRTQLILWCSMLLTACEDQGNEGDDNLLTGGSLILVLIVGFFLARRFMKKR